MSEKAKIAFKAFQIYKSCGRYAAFGFARKNGVSGLLVRIIQLDSVKDM